MGPREETTVDWFPSRKRRAIGPDGLVNGPPTQWKAKCRVVLSGRTSPAPSVRKLACTATSWTIAARSAAGRRLLVGQDTPELKAKIGGQTQDFFSFQLPTRQYLRHDACDDSTLDDDVDAVSTELLQIYQEAYTRYRTGTVLTTVNMPLGLGSTLPKLVLNTANDPVIYYTSSPGRFGYSTIPGYQKV